MKDRQNAERWSVTCDKRERLDDVTGWKLWCQATCWHGAIDIGGRHWDGTADAVSITSQPPGRADTVHAG